MDYIHNNPVKAGLVASAVDWKYSSAVDWLTDKDGLAKIDKEYHWLVRWVEWGRRGRLPPTIFFEQANRIDKSDNIIILQYVQIEKINYIHYNPVKHGHVKNPFDWKESSIQDFLKRGLYSADWGSREAININGDYGE